MILIVCEATAHCLDPRARAKTRRLTNGRDAHLHQRPTTLTMAELELSILSWCAGLQSPLPVT
jgi:hypothetical protein